MKAEQQQPQCNRKAFRIANVMRWLSRNSKRTIEVEIPRGYMNFGVSTCNNFIADTNDSAFWHTLKFPLPKPKYKWNVKFYRVGDDESQKRTVVLIDKF